MIQKGRYAKLKHQNLSDSVEFYSNHALKHQSNSTYIYIMRRTNVFFQLRET